jgi:hypothetical protein
MWVLRVNNMYAMEQACLYCMLCNIVASSVHHRARGGYVVRVAMRYPHQLRETAIRSDIALSLSEDSSEVYSDSFGGGRTFLHLVMGNLLQYQYQ